ncbi:hypothetical protein Zmor_023490 [Zophobas morio]|uniref:Uncharacterized protein n=1 Tax=Zophobas morio TaxID=2755281 RepID=A0AA38I0X0_9CUCU|nr:hypothetical protein Zmor_023490 [Zophobas morio]
MPSNKKIVVKGKVIHSQAREIIANVLRFMKDEAENGEKIPLKNFRARILAGTKIGRSTYNRIQKEAHDVEVVPKNVENVAVQRVIIHEGEIEAIRTIIHYAILEKGHNDVPFISINHELILQIFSTKL